MNAPKVGDKAPDFILRAGDGKEYTLTQFLGRKLVLYFYPADDTETCTAQACSFRDHMRELRGTGSDVIGISPDGPSSHAKFSKKYDLNFTILSDDTRAVMKQYGVWKKKKLFGRSYMGVVRTTFIIDERGYIREIFPNVRLKGHIDTILTSLTSPWA